MSEQTEQQHNISLCISSIPDTGKAVFSTLELISLLCILGTLHSILGFGKLHVQHFFALHVPIDKNYISLTQYCSQPYYGYPFGLGASDG